MSGTTADGETVSGVIIQINIDDESQAAQIKEHDGHETDKEMFKIMCVAQETLAETLAGCGQLASEHGDTLTENLCISVVISMRNILGFCAVT